MSRTVTILASVIAALVLLATIGGPPAHAATCGEYSNQAAAQHAHDTRDADGDGIYCESLPCPCAKPGDAGGGGDPQPDRWPAEPERLRAPQRGAEHLLQQDEVPQHPPPLPRRPAQGLAATLVLNRSGADARHDRLLAPYPTRPGQDRDEYPPAVGRGKGPGLEHLGPFESTLNTSGSTSSR